MSCKNCEAVRYCSIQCQKAQWSEHTAIFSEISELSKEGPGDSSDANVAASHISPEMHAKISKFVSKKCIVDCFINGTKLEAVWDTGSQVHLVMFLYTIVYVASFRSISPSSQYRPF